MKKIKFTDDKRIWKIVRENKKFAICTTYNSKKEVFYTIIDFKQEIRGTHNMIFNCYDFNNQKDIRACMLSLLNNKIEISCRNWVDLNIQWVRD